MARTKTIAIGGVAVLSALLGLFALKKGKKKPPAAEAPQPGEASPAKEEKQLDGDAIKESIADRAHGAWSAGTAVVVTPTVADFLDKLAAKLPGLQIFATSGKRDPESQARALKVKRDRGEDLHKLYQRDDLVDELLAVPNTVEDMARVIADQVRRGQFLSRHLRDDAVDLRSKILTQDQVELVMDTARKLGAKPLIESDHIHIEAIKA